MTHHKNTEVEGSDAIGSGRSITAGKSIVTFIKTEFMPYLVIIIHAELPDLLMTGAGSDTETSKAG